MKFDQFALPTRETDPAVVLERAYAVLGQERDVKRGETVLCPAAQSRSPT